ncbi:GrdX protein [Alkaliphilus metalliredigens QYMF]|uniref:GrdX protein n=1 Tax=Alkaliphilus metalliredigens (strain QYMF) TaxID=293826 RepID=A6TU50_ALKMQ|nr:GrdX family protein [Alkaliphilus metalliredigens]ABR49718.1 GrdX protein [Alkaliphilus metalliredigens QYMF]
MKAIIVTNNPRVKEKYSQIYQVVFEEGSVLDVLRQVRDYIHRGHELLTHPLSGSVKPNESPYKSVLVSTMAETVELNSVRIIEGSMETAQKLINMKTIPRWSEKVLQDFQVIDCSLIDSGIESMTQF